MTQRKITDDLHALLGVLPPILEKAVSKEDETDNLLEIIMDLGRVPTARFVDREVVLNPIEVTQADIGYVVDRIGEFDADNRAGIERTLHRISAIRNRRGHIVGLTCRVGRAVYGTTDILEDLIESGKSLLLLGRPGVGKCITGDSFILTADGLRPLVELIPDSLDVDQFTPLNESVYGINGLEAASHAYNGGLARTIKVTTRQGFSVTGTRMHPLLALTKTGELAFRRLDELKPGDYLAIQRGQRVFGQNIQLPCFEFSPHTNALDTNVPSELTEDLARFLGYVVAEGSLSYDNQITFSNTDPEVQSDMEYLTEALFGLRLRQHLFQGRWNGKDFRIFGVKVRRFLANLGLSQGGASSKTIPRCILTAPKPIVTAFLRALFEGDGSVYGRDGRVELASASHLLLKQVHILLLNYGIVGNFRPKYDRTYDRNYYYLTILGENLVRFANEIGFIASRKQKKLAKFVQNKAAAGHNPNLDIVPHQNERLRHLRSQVGVTTDTFYRFTQKDNRAPSYHSLRTILAEAQGVEDDPDYKVLHGLQEANLYFDPVTCIKEGEDYVYDLTIPESHSFFANGFVSHNTTMLREAARLLAETKRVIIVDTSNEIGGDGDVPHPAVGSARRMQVAMPSLQHEVMIEAVENHNPEVIVIDEIGRELEAAAARTIAERGVQLIGTAHGNTLENLLLNPTLSDLVGGIESVTLSDEEARRRGTQKTVLERRSPPTFDVLIEIQTRDRLAVHDDVAEAVDALLRGYPLPPELRYRDEQGEIQIERAPQQPRAPAGAGFRRQGNGGMPDRSRSKSERPPGEGIEQTSYQSSRKEERPAYQPIRIYPYGVARNRLMQAAKRLGVPAIVVNDVGDADAVVTLRSYYRKRQRLVVDAEHRGIPIYVLRANTVNQMQQFLSDLFNLEVVAAETSEMEPALQETQAAINAVLNGERWVELSPASAYLRRLQHQMARQANLTSHSYGKEPYRRVRIFRE